MDDDPLPFDMNLAPETFHQSHASSEILEELKKMNQRISNLYCLLGGQHTHTAGSMPPSAPCHTMDSPMVPSESEYRLDQNFRSSNLMGQGYRTGNTPDCHAASNEPKPQDNVSSHDNEQTQPEELIDSQSTTGFYAQTSMEMQAQQQTNPLGSHAFLSMGCAQPQPPSRQQVTHIGGFGTIGTYPQSAQQMAQQAPQKFEALSRDHLSRHKNPDGS